MNPISVTQDQDPAPGSSADAAQLIALVYRRLMHLKQDEAREIAHEAYARWLAFDRKETVRDPEAYLVRIAANVLADRRNESSREIVTYDSELASQEAERWGDRGIDSTERSLDIGKAIDAAFEQMPEKLRRPLELKLGSNLRREEIAKTLGLTVQTVRTYLADGMRFCREMIRQHLGEDS